MRDIKFRGLNTKGEWVYGSLVTTTHGIPHMQSTHTKTWIVESAFGNGGWFNVTRRQYVKPETVGQFIDRQDSNGTYIYEGDKIQKTAVIMGDHDFFGVVKFREGSFWIDNGREAIPVFCETAELKVIGNVHQSPELKP